MMTRIWLIIFSYAVMMGIASTSHAFKQPGFDYCKLKDSFGRVLRKVHCATISVPENYDKPEGKKIELFVVQFKAHKKSVKPDPLLLIAGGPGGAASETFVWPGKAFGKLRDERDIYLIDQRGTGRSNPMECEFDTEAVGFDSAKMKDLAQECLQSLPGDPRFYTTSVAIKDLEYVRKHLGATQWNIYGVSYGTRVVQHYLRQHPDSIRSAIVDGVAPADQNLGPMIPRDSQNALDYLIERCESSTECQSRFPSFKHELESLLVQLKEKSTTVTFESFSSGKAEELELSLEYLQIFIRLSIYSDKTAATIPLIVHEAVANRNYKILARIAKKTTEQLTSAISYGMHNSVMCTEDVPYYSKQELELATGEKTYMGSEFVKSLQALCSVWPVGVIDNNFKTPLKSNVPVLLMSGSADPITTAESADHLAKTLSSSKHLVVNDHGHGVYEVGCMPKLIAQFVNDASVKNVNGKCLKKQIADPFFININTAGP